MPENRQFLQRLNAWMAALQKQIFIPVMPLSFDGAPAPSDAGPDTVSLLPFAPMPEGTAWGERRAYQWFRTSCTLPDACTGRRVVLFSGVGGEQLVYLNGDAAGSIDRQHRYVTIFRSAPSHAVLEILIESYAGNGPRLENTLPCPPEEEPFEEPAGPQCRVEKSWLAVVNEDAYQLYMDADTLVQLYHLLPENSLRRMQIMEALDAFTHTADFEAPPEMRNQSYIRARRVLEKCLRCKNGSTAPLYHIIGQSHIDLAWLWPMEETSHKAARTFSGQLSLMDEYPEYRFLACEPALLDMLKLRHPRLFDRVKEKAEKGQITADGAFYVECDTNIPSGESLVRQLLWGRRWFRKELGTESRIAWQPDTFGFSPCLPQLLLGFGITGFATQKLLRADPECERFPFQDFIWEGPDGSRVQALCFFKNNARTDPENLFARWEKHRSQSGHIDSLLYPFGYGDGGGGADRDMLEYLRREEDLEGLPRTRWSTLEDHFEHAHSQALRNIWRGELYLAWHRGTYTVQRRTKVALHNLEWALHDAEFLLCACPPSERTACRDRIHEAWHTLMLHQFHDIAAGVGIRDVHLEAVTALEAQTALMRDLIRTLAEQVYGIRKEEDCVTVINTLPFERRSWIRTPWGTVCPVELPPGGCCTVTKDMQDAGDAGIVQALETEDGYDIQNGVLSFRLSRDGTICRLTDIRTGLPLQDEGMRMNDFRLYSNVESVYDAWELSRDCLENPLDAAVPVSFSVSGAGTPVLTARIRMNIGSSICEEDIIVHAGEDRIEFEAHIDWQERHKLLKVHFESNLQSDQAIHGMQFCHTERPQHRSTAYARDRYEVCQQRYSSIFEGCRGVTLLNRAIYGISCLHGDMALSLLRAPCVPDPSCDRGPQHFSFALKVDCVPFAMSHVTEDAYAFSHPPLMMQGQGTNIPGYRAENALIETIKPAEEGDGIVIRLWEYRGTRTRAVLHLPEKARICSCTMAEEEIRDIGFTDTFPLELPAFAIRTLMVFPDSRPVSLQ